MSARATQHGLAVQILCLMHSELPDVRKGTAVTRVIPSTGTLPAIVEAADGSSEEFSAVIFATHTDTTLAALGNLAPEVGTQSSPIPMPFGNAAGQGAVRLYINRVQSA